MQPSAALRLFVLLEDYVVCFSCTLTVFRIRLERVGILHGAGGIKRNLRDINMFCHCHQEHKVCF